MATFSRKQVQYDVDRMLDDMADRGWEGKDLAAAAGVSKMTVSRFLRRQLQTVKTGKRLSEALEKRPSHYRVQRRQDKRQRVRMAS